jgi:hypothetical protein
MKNISIAVLVAMLAGAPAMANDTTAELATGGLVFVRNDNVEMRSEELFISIDEIRVRYRFFNTSDQDVAVHVAFPMPDVRREEFDVNIPSDDPVNLLAFSTRVNGRAVKAEVEQKAFAGDVERTALLRELKIPLAPHLDATEAALRRLPPDKQDELVRLGVAEFEEYEDPATGRKVRSLTPRWSLRTTFHWEQTFPANKETLIEHRYKPSVGGTVMTSLGATYARGESWQDDYKKKYCIEQSTFDTLERSRRAAKSDGAPYMEERIDYILKTGANWSGPIKDFRLVVDKKEASALVSFCGEGMKKISPTRFEMRKTDFTPDRNLSVLILRRLRER